MESGQILAKMRRDRGFGPEKLRDLHFDVRYHGARLITSNRADFELIREYRNFKLEVWWVLFSPVRNRDLGRPGLGTPTLANVRSSL
jgi:hypothetical protein